MTRLICRNQEAISAAMRKPSVSIIDSVDLRLILSVLYTVVETMRVESDQETSAQRKNRETFAADLGIVLRKKVFMDINEDFIY